MAKKGKDLLAGLFDEAVKSVQGAGGHPMMNLRTMQDRYGVPRYCSSGYPSWDLHMMHDAMNKQWGFPYGRISELFGAQSSLKTRTCYELLAENIKLGGHSYFLTFEMDFDESYASEFLRKRNIKAGTDDLDYGAKPIVSMLELDKTVTAILKPYKIVADSLEKAGKNPLEHLPPILIAMDSMGALLSHGDKERLESDKKKLGFDNGKQVGQKASEIHNFFQKHMLDFARLGVLFVYTNHYRDNIGFGRKKYNPAHDSALKYYRTMQLEMKRGYDKDLSNERSSLTVSYRDGWPLTVKIRKTRNAQTLAGEFEIPFYENRGLDYTQSLLDAGKMSDVAPRKSGKYVIDFPKKHSLHKWNGDYAEASFKDLINSDVEFRVLLERACMRAGPKVAQDEIVTQRE